MTGPLLRASEIAVLETELPYWGCGTNGAGRRENVEKCRTTIQSRGASKKRSDGRSEEVPVDEDAVESTAVGSLSSWFLCSSLVCYCKVCHWTVISCSYSRVRCVSGLAFVLAMLSQGGITFLVEPEYLCFRNEVIIVLTTDFSTLSSSSTT